MAEQNEKSQQGITESDFQRAAADDRVGLVREFWEFLKDNKKWWPIMLCMAGLIIMLAVAAWGGGAMLPFTYTFW